MFVLLQGVQGKAEPVGELRLTKAELHPERAHLRGLGGRVDEDCRGKFLVRHRATVFGGMKLDLRFGRDPPSGQIREQFLAIDISGVAPHDRHPSLSCSHLAG